VLSYIEQRLQTKPLGDLMEQEGTEGAERAPLLKALRDAAWGHAAYK
jgi:hypothetical protein